MAKAMVVLSSYFPNFDLTDSKIAVWNEALLDLTDEQLMSGIKSFCLATKDIYPGTNVIAHIREYALGLHNQETAGEAWESVLGASGGRKTMSWKAPSALAARAAECVGGYREIGLSENIEATRAHFVKAFKDLQDRERVKTITGG